MKKKIIELFAGSRSVSQYFESQGWNSISVDNNPKLNPSICCDFLELDFSSLPRCVDFIWASVPCTTFSRAARSDHFHKRIISYRNYEYVPITEAAKSSVKLLSRTVEFISMHPECLFIIENPIGRIQHMPQMRKLGHYRYSVNYADFGFPYSKETYIFSNFFLPFSSKKVHSSLPGLHSVNSVFQRSKVPSALVQKIFEYLPS